MGLHIAAALIASGVVALSAVVLTPRTAPDDAIRSRIEAAAEGPAPPTAPDRETLRALYSENGYRAIWIDAAGRLTDQGWHALAAIGGAANDGLEPADYGVATLESLTWMLNRPTQASDSLIAQVDVSLSAALIRYLRELRHGRIDGRRLGFQLTPAVPRQEVAASLRLALATDTLDELIASFSPPLAQYRALRGALAIYRAMAARNQLALGADASGVIKPGETYPQLGPLAEWLAATGDLPDPPDTSSGVYDGPLVDAVRRFQERHGLTPDGIIGPRTRPALRVTPAQRVRQIEFAMERLRWLPDLTEARLVAVNIPMFRAWGWDRPLADPAPRLSMNVIVGQAVRTQTPVFAADMRQIIVRPSWTVPLSITRQEIIPLIKTHPGYLREQGMEALAGDGRIATADDGDATFVSKVSSGEYRLRQRPGPGNALGLIKFVFPNDASIYMHDTPQPELFDQSRRDFSHGCIRVEDPVKLAEWALAGTPEWTRARLVQAMAGTATVTITLHEPVQVVIFYATAVVDPEDNRIHFADDVYGHDGALSRALAGRMRR